jgi:hypothetical protein
VARAGETRFRGIAIHIDLQEHRVRRLACGDCEPRDPLSQIHGIDRLNALEQLDRPARLVGLQVADQVPVRLR